MSFIWFPARKANQGVLNAICLDSLFARGQVHSVFDIQVFELAPRLDRILEKMTQAVMVE